MKPWILLIFGLMIVLIIGGLCFFLFKSYTKENTPPTDVNITYKTILIKTLYKSNMTAVNFTLISNRTILKGETRNDSYSSLSVPENSNIMTFIPDDINYYRDEYNFTQSVNEFNLVRIGNYSIEQVGDFNSTEGTISLNVTTSDTLRRVSFCIRWSVNIIEVKNTQFSPVKKLDTELDCKIAGYNWTLGSENCNFACKMGLEKKEVISSHCEVAYLDVLPPKRLVGKIDRCFYSDKTLEKKDNLFIILDYKSYFVPNEFDFIKIYFLDQERTDSGMAFTDSFGNDHGAIDFIYEIKNN